MMEYQRKVFDDAAIAWMQTHCSNVCQRKGAQLFALDGEPEHIHLLVVYPPKLAVSAAYVETQRGSTAP